MRSYYHIERDYSYIGFNFIWFSYHQIRFISFGIWFIGLFLTDFTSLVTMPSDGLDEILLTFKIVSIIHIAFVALFFFYQIFKWLTDFQEKKPSLKMMVGCLFDLSIHFDICILIFSIYFVDYKNAIIILELLTIIDAALTLYLTPFKNWRAFVDLFGVLPTILILHMRLYEHKINYVFMFLPISIVCLTPLIFSLIVNIPKKMSFSTIKIVTFFDKTLLPNRMMKNFSRIQIQNDHNVNNENNILEQAPSINDKIGSGDENDYFDFKSFPFAVAATFFIHYGCFCQGFHDKILAIMCHYFLMLGCFLINSRVVAFPSIILTNVKDNSVQFSSVWPELSFV